MPALLVATDTNTTNAMTEAELTTARVRRHPLAVVVGLLMLSTLLLVALAVVALTDQGDDEVTEDTADGARPARSFHRARSMCRSGRRRITSGRPGCPSRSAAGPGFPPQPDDRLGDDLLRPPARTSTRSVSTAR